MNDLESMLADELSVPDDLAAPRVDVAGLARLGRAERRRRTGVGVAVAAAVAVVATTVATSLVLGGSDPRGDGGPGPAEQPLSPDRSFSPFLVSELPYGDPGTAPQFGGGTLRAGGTTYDVDRRDPGTTLYAAGTTVARVRRDGLWRGIVLAGGEAREVVSSSGRYPRFSIGLSADGRTVAVAERLDATAVEVTTYAAGSDEALGSHVFSGPGLRPSFSLLNVTNDGRVVVSADRFFVWEPGTEPVQVVLEGGVTVGDISYPDGIVVSGGGQSGVYGTISADGEFEEVGDLRFDSVTWSPSGESWTFTTSDGEQGGNTYVEGTDRELTVLPMPQELTVGATLGWEDEEHLVIEGTTSAGGDAERSTPVQLRCDVVDLTCERIPLGE